MDSINEMLFENEKNWLKECNAEDLATKYPISRPFCYAVTEEYLKSDNRILG